MQAFVASLRAEAGLDEAGAAGGELGGAAGRRSGCVVPALWGDAVPQDFRLGVVLGPSASGKSSMLRHLREQFPAPSGRSSDASTSAVPREKSSGGSSISVVSEVASVGRDAIDFLSAVGLNKVWTWMRPRRLCSNGERARVDLALRVDSHADIDDFAAVVDGFNASSMACGVARMIKREKYDKVLIATSKALCLKYLQPDFVVLAETGEVVLNGNAATDRGVQYRWHMLGFASFIGKEGDNKTRWVGEGDAARDILSGKGTNIQGREKLMSLWPPVKEFELTSSVALDEPTRKTAEAFDLDFRVAEGSAGDAPDGAEHGESQCASMDTEQKIYVPENFWKPACPMRERGRCDWTASESGAALVAVLGPSGSGKSTALGRLTRPGLWFDEASTLAWLESRDELSLRSEPVISLLCARVQSRGAAASEGGAPTTSEAAKAISFFDVRFLLCCVLRVSLAAALRPLSALSTSERDRVVLAGTLIDAWVTAKGPHNPAPIKAEMGEDVSTGGGGGAAKREDGGLVKSETDAGDGLPRADSCLVTAVVDEFTSHFDRGLAKRVCIQLSEFLRRVEMRGLRVVVAGVFEDVIPWLDPDVVLHSRSGDVTVRAARRSGTGNGVAGAGVGFGEASACVAGATEADESTLGCADGGGLLGDGTPYDPVLGDLAGESQARTTEENDEDVDMSVAGGMNDVTMAPRGLGVDDFGDPGREMEEGDEVVVDPEDGAEEQRIPAFAIRKSQRERVLQRLTPPVLDLYVRRLADFTAIRKVYNAIFTEHHYLHGEELPKNAHGWVVRHGPPPGVASVASGSGPSGAICHRVTHVPVGFVAVSPQPGLGQGGITMRESRLVVLPEYQGLGLGTRFSDEVAQCHLDAGLRYSGITAHPRLGPYRDRKIAVDKETGAQIVDPETGEFRKLWAPQQHSGVAMPSGQLTKSLHDKKVRERAREDYRWANNGAEMPRAAR